MSQQQLTEADKKRLEINTDSISNFVANSDMFGGQANIAKLATFKGNDVCADCGGEDNKWVSLELSVFLCMDCARVHKIMGEKFASVQKIGSNSALWGLEQIQAIGAAGNERVNSLYEYYLPSLILTPRQMRGCSYVKEDFIRSKYEKKLFLRHPSDDQEDEFEQRKKDFLPPFYQMPQASFVHEIEYSTEKSKKKMYTMVVIGPYVNLFKKAKFDKPKTQICLNNAKVGISFLTVKGLTSSVVKVKDSNENLHNIQISKEESLELVHRLRRASVYYGKSKDTVEKRKASGTKYDTSLLEKTSLKGEIKVGAKKKFVALIDKEICVFKSKKNLKVEEIISLKEADIENAKGQENTLEIRSLFSCHFFKFAEQSEAEKWLEKIKEVIETVSPKKAVDFKNDLVYSVD